MKQFSVLYYDGNTSLGRRAILTLSPGTLEIECQDDNILAHRLSWDVDKIHKIDIIENLHIVRYGDFPLQTIECSEKGFSEALKQVYPDAAFLRISPLAQVSGLKAVVVAVALVAFLIGAYFFVLPPVAEFIAGRIPQQVEVELGNSLYSRFVEDEVRDDKLGSLLNKFAREIDFNTTYPIKITVVKSSEVNAFALPGGNIVVYDGILKKINTAEELAALLSHEAAHIAYKHSLKSISRNLSGYVFISLILNDLNGFTTILIDNANSLNNLSYSRALESDADIRALETLKKNHLSQYGLVGLFQILSKEGGDNEYLKFLSTHPLTSERMAYAKAQALRQEHFSSNSKLNAIWKEIQLECKKAN